MKPAASEVTIHPNDPESNQLVKYRLQVSDTFFPPLNLPPPCWMVLRLVNFEILVFQQPPSYHVCGIISGTIISTRFVPDFWSQARFIYRKNMNMLDPSSQNSPSSG